VAVVLPVILADVRQPTHGWSAAVDEGPPPEDRVVTLRRLLI
jgi:hypothetical protein